MSILRLWLSLSFTLASLWPLQAIASAVQAKKDGVEITAEPKKDSSVILTLKKGESLDSVERKGMYWQVKTADGKLGFVSVMHVTQKPSDGDKNLSKAIRDATKNDRAMADDPNAGRARSAVMGVRGLDESSDTQFAGNVKPNLRMVYAMEDRSVSAKKIDELQAKVTQEIEAKLAN